MSTPEETPIFEDQRRLSQNGALNAAFIQHPPSQHPPSQHTSSDAPTLQQTLQLLQQQLAQQQQLISQLVQQQQVPQILQPVEQQPFPKPSNPELIIEALASNITEFRYDADAGVTFESWYARYEDLFAQDASRLDDAAKVRLMGRKLGTAEHARFSNFILPRFPRDLTFYEMVEKLNVLFGKMESVLSKRYKCLTMEKQHNEDLLAYTCRVNKACVDSEFASMTEMQFKCLILVCGLKDDNDRDIRMKLLAAIEDRKDATLEQLAAECQRLARVKADSFMIASDTTERVNAVQAGSGQQYRGNNERGPKEFREYQNTSKPRNPCWLCGSLHWTRDCSYRTHQCSDCGRTGHREGFCSPSNRRRGRNLNNRRNVASSRAVRVNTLQLYDMDIEFVPTGSFGNADILSRPIEQHSKPDPENVIASLELEEDLRHIAVNALTSFPLSFRDVEKTTQADPLLRKVHKYVQDGWPHDVTYGEDLARFHDRKDSLSTVEGCILFGERVIIPEKLRSRCLLQLHNGHPGMQRMKAIARSYLYWPKLDEDIVNYVAACGACSSAAKAPPRATPAAWPTPSGVWRRVHVDYAGPWEGFYFLVVVDAFSKWPEIYKTNNTTTAATISMLRNIFARFGMPETLVSDNGPQFTSSLFAEFCNGNGIEHITTAPFHPQSNGQAERFVDTLKRALRKIQSNETSLDEALEIFLMTYRSTPNAQLEQQRTPAEEMFGRTIRTALELLRPPPPSSSSQSPVPSFLSERRFHHDEPIYIKWFTRNVWKWIPAKIVRSRGRVMYDVMAEDGRLLRRHINQIRRRVVSSAARGHQLPLDILLAEWTTSCTPDPILSDSTPLAPRVVPATSSQLDHPCEHTEATAAPQLMELPRRSSRVRRPPRRLGAYQLN